MRDRLVVNRCDRSVAVLDGGRVIELADGYAVNRITVSNDGTRIAGAMGDRSVKVWDAATGKLLAVLRGHSDLVMDVAFSPDGSELASRQLRQARSGSGSWRRSATASCAATRAPSIRSSGGTRAT